MNNYNLIFDESNKELMIESLTNGTMATISYLCEHRDFYISLNDYILEYDKECKRMYQWLQKNYPELLI